MLRGLAVCGVLLLGGCAAFRPLPEAPTPPSDGEVRQALPIVGADGPASRRTRENVTRKLADEGEGTLLDLHLAALRTVSDAPLIAGNQARLLVDGPRAYAAMFASIAAARNHVNIEMYIFDEAHHGEQSLSDLLVERVKQGVVVNVLYDGVGSSATPAPFIDKLRAGGVQLCVYNPLNPAANRTLTFTQRDHRKIVVVDGSIAYTGGINFSSTYTSSSRRRAAKIDALKDGWRDTQIEVRGPASHAMQELFLGSWEKQQCPPLAPANYQPDGRNAGSMLLRLVAASPDDRRSETYLTALSAVNQARRSIDLTMAYFAPDTQLEKALQAAARRGVQVRLLLSGLTDFGGILHAGRAHYTRLMKSGVRIFEERRALLHAKTLEVDGVWSTVGSSNWDRLSFAGNDELDVVVIDNSFAAQMRELFDADLRDAVPIALDTWRKRPLRQKLRERFWATWERFL